MTIESSISSILHVTHEIVTKLARIENSIIGTKIIIETLNETLGCIRVFAIPSFGDMVEMNGEVYSVYKVAHLYDLSSGKTEIKVTVLRNED